MVNYHPYCEKHSWITDINNQLDLSENQES